MHQTVTINLSIEDLKALLRDILRDEVGIQVRPQQVEEKRYLTRAEVSSLLRLSIPTIRKYEKAGLLPARRIGRRIMYLERDVAASVALINGKKYHKLKEQ